ncbi:MAG: ATP-binding cassette domain-containing protein, partial [Candidatus Phytoplasma sp.]|nr:ATP-binding cassette domain-containing protein [Phytoplasma sp.]
METYAIHVEDLTVSYDLKPVLWDIDLSIPKGVLMAIVGPNGAGKSTLIKSMIDLIKKVSGKTYFNGKPYKDMRKKIAYIPQRGSVDWDFPTTVLDVVMMGR